MLRPISFCSSVQNPSTICRVMVEDELTNFTRLSRVSLAQIPVYELIAIRPCPITLPEALPNGM